MERSIENGHLGNREVMGRSRLKRKRHWSRIVIDMAGNNVGRRIATTFMLFN